MKIFFGILTVWFLEFVVVAIIFLVNTKEFASKKMKKSLIAIAILGFILCLTTTFALLKC